MCTCYISKKYVEMSNIVFSVGGYAWKGKKAEKFKYFPFRSLLMRDMKGKKWSL